MHFAETGATKIDANARTDENTACIMQAVKLRERVETEMGRSKLRKQTRQALHRVQIATLTTGSGWVDRDIEQERRVVVGERTCVSGARGMRAGQKIACDGAGGCKDEDCA